MPTVTNTFDKQVFPVKKRAFLDSELSSQFVALQDEMVSRGLQQMSSEQMHLQLQQQEQYQKQQMQEAQKQQHMQEIQAAQEQIRQQAQAQLQQKNQFIMQQQQQKNQQALQVGGGCCLLKVGGMKELLL